MQLITLLSIITSFGIMVIPISGLTQAFAQTDENNNPAPTINGLKWKTNLMINLGLV